MISAGVNLQDSAYIYILYTVLILVYVYRKLYIYTMLAAKSNYFLCMVK